jgi:hypothetical protein
MGVCGFCCGMQWAGKTLAFYSALHCSVISNGSHSKIVNLLVNLSILTIALCII